MLATAVKAGLSLITVQTDDLLNANAVITTATGLSTLPLPKQLPLTVGKHLYLCDDQERLTPALYHACQANDRQVVFLNCKPMNLAFDAGPLIPPSALVLKKATEMAGKGAEELMPLLKSMSLKRVDEVLKITAAKFGDLTPKHVRYIRSMLGESLAGLYPLETPTEYYEPTPELADWVKTQAPYILNPATPGFMVPRGIMFAGKPGVGKTMGAKYIAKTLGLPLYRLDIATTLNRYIGESESRIAASLQQLDKEEPCVVLFDEVEKIFGKGDKDNPVIERMLSQILWWLQDHTSRVLTVMTTNDLQALPPELYREGRLDLVLEIPLLSLPQAMAMSHRLLNEMVPTPVPIKYVHALTTVFKVIGTTKSQFSHAEVRKIVVEQIKKNKWVV